MQCFLDMDGVLCDFVSGICRAHGRPSPYGSPESIGCFDIDKLWGISARQFWAPANNCPEFWRTLDPTPEAEEIIALAATTFGGDNVAILTAPSMDPACVPGKREWIAKRWPVLKDRIIFGSAKHFLAAPNKVLIDDRDKNVEEFREAGGLGVLVPRPWNKRHAASGMVMEVLRNEMIVVQALAEERD